MRSCITNEHVGSMLKAAAYAAIVGSGIEGMIVLIGWLEASSKVSRFLNQHDCKPEYHFWKYHSNETALEACGKVCAVICEKADSIYAGVFGGVAKWGGVAIGSVTAMGLVWYGFSLYQQNKQNPELQHLVEQEDRSASLGS